MINIYNPNQQNEPAAKPPLKPVGAKPDFRRYDDVGGDFDNKELEYSIWWVKYKVLIYRTSIAVLLAINVLLWGISGGKWLAYIIGTSANSKLTSASAVFNDYTGIKDHFAPLQIQVLNTNLFPGGVKKYDAVTVVQNPNSDFIATIHYQFILSNTSTALSNKVLLPGEQNLLTALGIDEELATGGQINIKIEKVSWSRVSAHKVSDPKAWQDERLRFAVSNFLFQSPLNTDVLKTNRIAFTIKNEGAFSYKTPKFIVGLYSGQTLIGVLPLQTEDFIAGEEKNIELRSFSNNVLPGEIKVFPQINIYDNSVYLSPEK